MKIQISREGKYFLFAIIVIFLIVFVYSYLVKSYDLMVCFILLLIAVLYVIDKINKKLDTQFQQTESLLSLFATTKPRAPFPHTRGWATSPDILKRISELVLIEKPEIVLEASSGISTLVIAYCLQKIGSGKVVSLEHEAKYAALTQEMVTLHGLEDVVTIIHAPLKEYILSNSEKWLWYDVTGIDSLQSIDMFVIDGPPRKTQQLARYPAIPLLYNKLSDKSVVVLDDGARSEEAKIIQKWELEFNDLSFEFVPVEKGAFVIRKES